MGELDDVRRRVRAAANEALHYIGNDLLGKAQRLAPIEEGTLRASGELEVNELPNGGEAVVSFNTVYAARQHEETDWQHPKAGQAKYLEQPLHAEQARYERIFATALARGVTGGGGL